MIDDGPPVETQGGALETVPRPIDLNAGALGMKSGEFPKMAKGQKFYVQASVRYKEFIVEKKSINNFDTFFKDLPVSFTCFYETIIDDIADLDTSASTKTIKNFLRRYWKLSQEQYIRTTAGFTNHNVNLSEPGKFCYDVKILKLLDRKNNSSLDINHNDSRIKCFEKLRLLITRLGLTKAPLILKNIFGLDVGQASEEEILQLILNMDFTAGRTDIEGREIVQKNNLLLEFDFGRERSYFVKGPRSPQRLIKSQIKKRPDSEDEKEEDFDVLTFEEEQRRDAERNLQQVEDLRRQRQQEEQAAIDRVANFRAAAKARQAARGPLEEEEEQAVEGEERQEAEGPRKPRPRSPPRSPRPEPERPLYRIRAVSPTRVSADRASLLFGGLQGRLKFNPYGRLSKELTFLEQGKSFVGYEAFNDEILIKAYQWSRKDEMLSIIEYFQGQTVLVWIPGKDIGSAPGYFRTRTTNYSGLLPWALHFTIQGSTFLSKPSNDTEALIAKICKKKLDISLEDYGLKGGTILKLF